MRRRARLSVNAVGIQAGAYALAHGIFSEPPSDHTDRSYDTVENDTQNNSGVDPTEHVSDHHPAFVRPE